MVDLDDEKVLPAKIKCNEGFIRADMETVKKHLTVVQIMIL